MDGREFRNAMGRFATGVTIITAPEQEGGVHGMTANAFVSISLDPKLVMISIDNRANMLETIRKADKFGVSFLREEQQPISMHFANQKPMEEEIEFAYMDNIPYIPNSLASVVCDVHEMIVAGDHTLFIGKVLDTKVQDGNPLLFYQGQYRSIEENEE